VYRVVLVRTSDIKQSQEDLQSELFRALDDELSCATGSGMLSDRALLPSTRRAAPIIDH
jgi:uncharacterized metal-binding protein